MQADDHVISSKLIALFFVLVLTGCSGSGFIHPWQFDNLPPEKTGVVFVSLVSTTDWSFGTSYGLDIRQIGDKPAQAVLRSIRSEVEGDFRERGVEGEVVLLRLLPGNYEIFDAHVIRTGASPYATISIRYHNKGPFSYRFRVEAGKATYLGAYVFSSTRPSVMLGGLINASSGLAVRVADQLGRDWDILEKKGHKYLRQDVIESVMSVSDTAGSVFTRMDR